DAKKDSKKDKKDDKKDAKNVVSTDADSESEGDAKKSEKDSKKDKKDLKKDDKKKSTMKSGESSKTESDWESKKVKRDSKKDAKKSAKDTESSGAESDVSSKRYLKKTEMFKSSDAESEESLFKPGPKKRVDESDATSTDSKKDAVEPKRGIKMPSRRSTFKEKGKKIGTGRVPPSRERPLPPCEPILPSPRVKCLRQCQMPPPPLKPRYAPLLQNCFLSSLISVGESSKKLWNQQYFTITFPKSSQPGGKKRLRPSEILITVPRHDKRNVDELQKPAHIWIRHSLRKKIQSPSINLTVMRQASFRHPYTHISHSKRAESKKYKDDKKGTALKKISKKDTGLHEIDEKPERGNKAEKTPSKSSHGSQLSKSKSKSETNPESKDSIPVSIKYQKKEKTYSKDSKEMDFESVSTEKYSRSSKNNSEAISETCSKNSSNVGLMVHLGELDAESMEFDMWLKNYSQNNSKKPTKKDAKKDAKGKGSDAESADSKDAKKDKKGATKDTKKNAKKDKDSTDAESGDSKDAKKDSKKGKKGSKKDDKKKDAKKDAESTDAESGDSKD
ncbi:cylicin-1, partial [Oryx dammah]|uniref:cylicin-1 n=1 Tax=Oryx dammah TaxID=59534 RepID=UPI001A9BBFF4